MAGRDATADIEAAIDRCRRLVEAERGRPAGDRREAAIDDLNGHIDRLKGMLAKGDNNHRG